MPSTIPPVTGIERIAFLEAQVEAMRSELSEMKETTRSIESLLLQGRGAMRAVHWIIGIAGLLSAGYFSHAKVGVFLKWLGS